MDQNNKPSKFLNKTSKQQKSSVVKQKKNERKKYKPLSHGIKIPSLRSHGFNSNKVRYNNNNQKTFY